jgi:hypothetical protein
MKHEKCFKGRLTRRNVYRFRTDESSLYCARPASLREAN